MWLGLEHREKKHQGQTRPLALSQALGPLLWAYSAAFLILRSILNVSFTRRSCVKYLFPSLSNLLRKFFREENLRSKANWWWTGESGSCGRRLSQWTRCVTLELQEVLLVLLAAVWLHLAAQRLPFQLFFLLLLLQFSLNSLKKINWIEETLHASLNNASRGGSSLRHTRGPVD